MDQSEWTTVMIQNIPCRYTHDDLRAEVSSTGLQCNFLYMPHGKSRKGNRSYGFVNFLTPSDAQKFISLFHDKRFQYQVSTEKQAKVSFARLQGLEQNVRFYNRRYVSKIQIGPWIAESVLQGMCD